MKRFLFTFLVLLSGIALLPGDTVILKDGTELKGKILSENSTSYTMSVEVAAGIKDEQVISKSKVKSVERTGPDEAAFEAIKDLAPAPDRLTAAKYKERIGQGQAFLNVFPDSKHAPKVKEMMAKLENERQLAVAGALKLDGRWISAEDRAANAFEIDARILLSEMKADFEAGKATPEGRGYMLALRHFEKFEAEFSGSEIFPEAREVALDILAKYEPIVANDYARVDSRLKKRATAMESLSPSDRRAEEGTIEARDKRYKQRVEAERKAKTKWLTLSRYHKEPLRQVLSNISSTIRRLDKPIPEDAKVAGPIYREAWAAAVAGNAAEAKKKIGELKSLKVPERYIVPILAQVESNEVDPKDKKPTTTAPTEAEKAKAKAEAEAEAEKTKTAAEAKKKKEREKKDSTTGTQPRTADMEGEKKGFSMQIILVIVLVVVIVVALLAAFGGKKNKN